MIKTDVRNGDVAFTVQGGTVDLIDELIVIIKGIHRFWSDEVGEEFSRRSIALAGQMAFAESDEDREAICKEYEEWLEEDAKKRIETAVR